MKSFLDTESLQNCLKELKNASQRCHPDDTNTILEAANALEHMAKGTNILLTALASAVGVFNDANIDLEVLEAEIKEARNDHRKN